MFLGCRSNLVLYVCWVIYNVIIYPFRPNINQLIEFELGTKINQFLPSYLTLVHKLTINKFYPFNNPYLYTHWPINESRRKENKVYVLHTSQNTKGSHTTENMPFAEITNFFSRNLLISSAPIFGIVQHGQCSLLEVSAERNSVLHVAAEQECGASWSMSSTIGSSTTKPSSLGGIWH